MALTDSNADTAAPDSAHTTLLTSLCIAVTRSAHAWFERMLSAQAERTAALAIRRQSHDAARLTLNAQLAVYGIAVVGRQDTDLSVAVVPTLPPSLPLPVMPITPRDATDHIVSRYAQYTQHALVPARDDDDEYTQLHTRERCYTELTEYIERHQHDPALIFSLVALVCGCPDTPEYTLLRAIAAYHSGVDSSPLESSILTQSPQYIPHPDLCDAILEQMTQQPGHTTVVTALAWLGIVSDTPRGAIEFTRFSELLSALEIERITMTPDTIPLELRSLEDAFAVPAAPALAYTGFDAVQNAVQPATFSRHVLAVTAKYLPKASKSEQQLPGEDTLLFDTSDKAAIAILTDGVSQSVYGYHAAQQLTLALWRVWRSLPDTPTTADGYLNTLLVPALALASHITEAYVTDAVAANEGFLRSVLQEGYDQTGSQAIFAVVVLQEHHIACLWMGNTRIMLTSVDSVQTIDSVNRHTRSSMYFSPTDVDFLDDKHRFSSQKRVTPVARGMRNTAFVHLVDTTQLSDFRIIVHTDALEPYAVQIAANDLSKPLPLTYANMREAAKRDDATLIDIVVTKHDRETERV